MGKTLGLNDDLWHGILSFIGVVVFSFLYSKLLLIYNPALNILVCIMHGIIWVTALQGFYESIQLLSSDVEKVYGSWQNARKNSKRDWKYWAYGVFLGISLSALGLSIL